MRGHGRSDKPVQESVYTAQQLADDFVEVSEAFGLRKPILCGWSVCLNLSDSVNKRASRV